MSNKHALTPEQIQKVKAAQALLDDAQMLLAPDNADGYSVFEDARFACLAILDEDDEGDA